MVWHWRTWNCLVFLYSSLFETKLGPYGTNQDHTEPIGTIRNQSGVNWEPLEPIRTLNDPESSRPYGTLQDNMWLFKITWDYSWYKGPIKTIQGHSELFISNPVVKKRPIWSIKDQSGTNRTNWNHYTQLIAYRTFWDLHQEQSWTIQDQTEPNKTNMDYAGPSWTMSNYTGWYGSIWSDSTNIDHKGPILTKQDQYGPNRTHWDHTGPW